MDRHGRYLPTSECHGFSARTCCCRSEPRMATTTVPSTLTSFLTGRLAGLDALRGGAMLLGVLLHAAMAYMPTRIRHMLWPVMDEPTSVICDVVYWGALTFRLPLFF